jgi:hypothetical protein
MNEIETEESSRFWDWASPPDAKNPNAEAQETMAAAGQEPKTTTTTPAVADGTTAAATTQTVVEAPQVAKEETAKPKSKPQAQASAEGEGPSRHRLKGDEEIPEEAELIEMTQATLTRRLNRHSKAELRAQFGTDNVEEIKSQLAEYKKLKEERETAEKEKLSEAEKLKAELETERKLRMDADRRVQETHRRIAVRQQTGRVTKIASEYVGEKHIKRIIPEFAEYLDKTYNDEQMGTLSDKEIGKWWKNFVKENPEYGAVAPTKKPLDNGPDDRGMNPEAAGKTLAPVNYSPKGPNAMSKGQAIAAAAKEGIRWT